jgi:hypothetical protein
MELLIFVAGLVLLCYLALRFGADSRPRPYSREEEYAVLGMTWDAAEGHMFDLRREAAAWRMAQRARVQRTAAWRRVAARSLRGLAARLSPELGERPRAAANGRS